ncbi:MAG: DUF4390 domain-containing protein [Nitrospinota bacterium]|nr:DUF4390 domain-containing protein [Nitrospinota bacterium]
MTTFLKTFRAVTFVAMFWGLLVATGMAKPAITKVSLNTQKDLITLDAELIDAFSEKIKEAIESGVPMTFTYEIELRKQSSVFGDEVVSQNKVTQTVQFDTLKKVYQFSSQGKNVNRQVSTKSIERYQELMLTLKDIPIAHVFKLDPEEKYYVRVKAEMEADGLWFPFNYLLFFVPFNNFETPWTQSTPLTIQMDPAFGVEASQNKSKAAIPAKGVADGIRSFNQ